MLWHSTEYLCHVQAENDKAGNSKDPTEAKLIECVLWVDPSNVEVDRSLFPTSQSVVRLYFNGHVIHFICNLRDVANWEIGAKLGSPITHKSNVLVRCFWIQDVPNFVFSVFAAHLHAKLHF